MADIVINGVTYPAPKRVALPGSDGKPVFFDLPEDADKWLNAYSERPVQNKVIHAAIQDVRQRQTSPFNFKGSCTYANLPGSGNAVNDTWYVTDRGYRMTWTGSAWQQSSMDESTYTDDLAGLQTNAEFAAESAEDNFEQITGNRALVFKRGRYSSQSISFTGETISYSDSANYCCAICKCEPGDRFTINVYGPSGVTRGWFFADENMVHISHADGNTMLSGTRTAPSGAAYFMVSNKLENLPDGYYAYKGESLKDVVAGEAEKREQLEDVLLDSTDVSVNIVDTLGNELHPLGCVSGAYDSQTGAAQTTSRYIRTVTGGDYELVAPPFSTSFVATAPSGKYIAVSEFTSDGQYLTRHGVPNNVDGNGTREVSAPATPGHIYKITVGITAVGEDSSTWITPEIIDQISLVFRVQYLKDELLNYRILTGNLSSYTIVCAKENNFSDGTGPEVEWYLVESPDKDFYLTKDFCNFKYLFTADEYNSFRYKYAVLKNGDIIAVRRVEHISSGSDENNRRNPFVYLASENWAVKHEVDFGASLKPCGWLENCGFVSMPNGDAMFCEYTRPGVVTANCWKISGDPTDSTSWHIVKSFTLSGHINEGFKHCHAVNYDYYNDVYYLCTGDDDVGAMVWYSIDDGDSWTLAREPSEKYCRVLNMIFTPEYIYWASDTTLSGMHYLFRCERNNGVIDYSTVTELANLYVAGVASYGISYIYDYNAIVIMDKADSKRTTLPFRIYDINSNSLLTMGTLETANGETQFIGFRTEYTSFTPSGASILCGFGKTLGQATYRNFIKGLGNAGDPAGWENNVNNLCIKIVKQPDGYGYKMMTAFSPK